MFSKIVVVAQWCFSEAGLPQLSTPTIRSWWNQWGIMVASHCQSWWISWWSWWSGTLSVTLDTHLIMSNDHTDSCVEELRQWLPSKYLLLDSSLKSDRCEFLFLCKFVKRSELSRSSIEVDNGKFCFFPLEKILLHQILVMTLEQESLCMQQFDISNIRVNIVPSTSPNPLPGFVNGRARFEVQGKFFCPWSSNLDKGWSILKRFWKTRGKSRRVPKRWAKKLHWDQMRSIVLFWIIPCSSRWSNTVAWHAMPHCLEVFFGVWPWQYDQFFNGDHLKILQHRCHGKCHKHTFSLVHYSAYSSQFSCLPSWFQEWLWLGSLRLSSTIWLPNLLEGLGIVSL